MFWEGGDIPAFIPPKNVRVGYQYLTSLVLGRIKKCLHCQVAKEFSTVYLVAQLFAYLTYSSTNSSDITLVFFLS